MWSTENERLHFRRNHGGAYALKLVGEYAAVAGLIGLITAGASAALQSLSTLQGKLALPSLKIALVSVALLAAGFVAVSLAWRWARRSGFNWNYPHDRPASPDV